MGLIEKIIMFPYNIKLKIQLKKFLSTGKNIHISPRWLFVNPGNISLGDNFFSGKGLKLSTWPIYRGNSTSYVPRLKIGNNVSIMDYVQISCLTEVIIEDGCLIGDFVYISDNNHGDGRTELNTPPIERKLSSKGHIHIGKNVWIGKNACIMQNVTIGEGATIGANSVVTHNVPPYSIAVGAPAKVIRKLPNEYSLHDEYSSFS